MIKKTSWKSALNRVAELLRDVKGEEILFLGSAYATVEDNYLLKQLAENLGAAPPRYIAHVEPGSGDGWLITEDKAPNAQGCERLGILPIDEALLHQKLHSGQIKVLYLMEDDVVSSGLLSTGDLHDVKVILHYHNTTNQTLLHASVALPAAMIVETIGTLVNEDGRAQKVRPAKAIRTMNRSLLMETGQSRLDRHGTPFDRWHNEDNKIDCRPSWDLLQELGDVLGHPMRYKSPQAIMNQVASLPEFEGATYEAMGEDGIQLADITTADLAGT